MSHTVVDWLGSEMPLVLMWLLYSLIFILIVEQSSLYPVGVEMHL